MSDRNLELPRKPTPARKPKAAKSTRDCYSGPAAKIVSDELRIKLEDEVKCSGKRKRAVQPDPPDASERLIIAIDFGSSYSGIMIAWSEATDETPDPRLIDRWPGLENTTADKVPSTLVYDEDDHGTIKWGYEVENNYMRLRFFKLLLDEPHESMLPPKTSEAINALLQHYNKNPEAVMVDFLRQLHLQAEMMVTARFGDVMSDDVERHYVLTVPACWTDDHKRATERCAEASGMQGALHLLSEPEAAGIYVLNDMRTILDVDDTFVVCDVGGGTTDLITYRITRLRPLEFKEVVPGSGGICGSIQLDDGFRSLLRSKLGETTFKQVTEDSPGQIDTAMKHFEYTIKRSFGKPGEVELQRVNGWHVPLGLIDDDHERGIEYNSIRVTFDEVEQIFEPVVDHISNLITEQLIPAIEAGWVPRKIILAGGLGESAYVQEEISRKFSRRQLQDEAWADGVGQFSVIHSPNSWTAIVRGAMMFGLSKTQQVVSRKARLSYGVKYDAVVDEDHPPAPHSHVYEDQVDGVTRAKDQMHWWIRKGEDVSTARPRTRDYIRYHDGDTPPSQIKIDLYKCDDRGPPKKFSDMKIRKHCQLVVPTHGIPSRSWRRIHRADGTRCLTLRYKLKISIEAAARLKFGMSVGKTFKHEMEQDFS